MTAVISTRPEATPQKAVSAPANGMRVEMWPLKRLKPYPGNPRKIPQGAIDKVAASIKEFGWRQPIVVDEQEIILVGHTRLAAAEKLKLAEAPVHVAEGLTPEQARAYRLADNRTNQDASWNDELLKLELSDLKALDFDLSLTGFDMGELDRLLGSDGDQGGTDGDGTGSLADRFGVPPFSVLDARQGYWQDRKRAWLALGIQSELGRGAQLIPNGGGMTSKDRYAGVASPGGSPRPACDYGRGERGDGAGRPLRTL